MKILWLALALTFANLALLVVLLFQLRPAVAMHDVAPVLRAQRLEIVDDRGTIRARINIEPTVTMPDGKTYVEEVVFRMAAPTGQTRVKLGAGKDGSGLILADDSPQPGLHLLATAENHFLKVINKDGREQIVQP